MWSYSGKYWHGRDQIEDKSPENISRCYRWLRSLPYASNEDLRRLSLLEDEAVKDALVRRAEDILGKNANE